MAQFVYRGIDIDVDHKGYFKATVDGANLFKPTLIELQTEIEDELKAASKAITVSLPVTGIVGGGMFAGEPFHTAHGVVTGIHRNTGQLVISGPPASWQWVLADSEENRQLCSEFVEALLRYNSLRKRVERLWVRSPASGRVSHHEYRAKIEELIQRYRVVAPPPAVRG